MRLSMYAVLVALPLAACASVSAAPEASPVAAAPPPTAPAPATSIEDRVRGLLAESTAWPRATPRALAKNELCAATIPRGPRPSTHVEGQQFHTFVAPGALGAYLDGKTLPGDAAVLKRTFDPKTSQVTAFFLMFKQHGAASSTGDWLYATAGADGSILRAGALRDCIGCHAKQGASDFLFRAL